VAELATLPYTGSSRRRRQNFFRQWRGQRSSRVASTAAPRLYIRLGSGGRHGDRSNELTSGRGDDGRLRGPPPSVIISNSCYFRAARLQPPKPICRLLADGFGGRAEPQDSCGELSSVTRGGEGGWARDGRRSRLRRCSVMLMRANQCHERSASKRYACGASTAGGRFVP